LEVREEEEGALREMIGEGLGRTLGCGIFGGEGFDFDETEEKCLQKG
jgi:hypothetical protein